MHPDPEDDELTISNKNGISTKIISNVVILFDELEKAHHSVKQSLITLLDEGYVEISYTKRTSALHLAKNLKIKYQLKKSIIIATSNLFQEHVLQAFINNYSIDQITKGFESLNATLSTTDGYSPELMNRVSVIPFGPIPKGIIYQQILKNNASTLLKQLKKDLQLKDIAIENEEVFYAYLENKLYGNGVGLRKIKTFFKEKLTSIIRNDSTKRNWGNTANKKLTLYIDQDQLWIRLSTFIRDGYIATPLEPFHIE